MQARTVALLLAILLGISAATLVSIRAGFASLTGRVETIAEQEVPALPDYSTTWTDATGKVHTVNTTCAAGESDADCFARHKRKVALAEAEWPPVENGG